MPDSSVRGDCPLSRPQRLWASWRRNGTLRDVYGDTRGVRLVLEENDMASITEPLDVEERDPEPLCPNCAYPACGHASCHGGTFRAFEPCPCCGAPTANR